MSRKKVRVSRIGRRLILIPAVMAVLCSCNVTRKITTESSYFTSGDTTTTIVTKTIETYDASKKQ